ncbi:glycosyltransferase [Pontibacter oryzae]|uniref:Glycosyltransferase n=2 Tax=Pontibacter oryzae TaxID=2304593 RepID=A0A399RWL8_9BACT|nr:glycosyltransferase [Pontibacter oryzae]
MTWLLFAALLWYSWIILNRWWAWQRMPQSDVRVTFLPHTSVTVIIPVRNEARRIQALLHDLDRQNYPKQLLEVLVVDDHSDDDTVALVQEYGSSAGLPIRLIQLNNYVQQQGKKAAVQLGVAQAKGELLVFTDGDCRVGEEWLRSYAFLYESEQPYFISGPVCFSPTLTHFERMQLVEFASLIGIGGASIAIGKPNMCNGANLAYTKRIFEEVGGFSGNEQIASGDDEFLLHKVDKLYPGKVIFLKNPKAMVYTEARKTLVSFIQQRVRWASKWKSYQNAGVQLVALCVFLINFLLFLAIPLVLTGNLPVGMFLAAYAIKFAVDYLFLKLILSFMRRPDYLWYVLPLQFVYIPYVVFTGIYGLLGRYRWKGRTIRTP